MPQYGAFIYGGKDRELTDSEKEYPHYYNTYIKKTYVITSAQYIETQKQAHVSNEDIIKDLETRMKNYGHSDKSK